MNRFVTAALLMLLAFAANSQTQWLGLYVAPKASFTGNYPTGYARYRGNRLGSAFDAGLSYGRMLPGSAFFVALQAGYAGYRLSVDERILDMYLARHTLSYNFRYLQLTAKIGFVHRLGASGISLSPYLGFRYLFYLPVENISSSYRDVDLSLFQSNDLTSARYRTVQDGAAIHAFALTGGVRLSIPLTPTTALSLAPFGDLGLTILRMNLYESEQLYTRNEDILNTDVAVSKGDALGVEIDLSHALGGR